MTPVGHATPSGGCRRRRAFVAMWTSIAVSALVAALVAGGWSDRAWGIAMGLLAVSCIAVCLWAGLATERSNRKTAAFADRRSDCSNPAAEIRSQDRCARRAPQRTIGAAER